MDKDDLVSLEIDPKITEAVRAEVERIRALFRPRVGDAEDLIGYAMDVAAMRAAASLESSPSELLEALREAREAMTCRRDDDAHYCPNCDNSLYEARAKIDALLERTSRHG